jgi:predicted amidophosphoribosyltransferase
MAIKPMLFNTEMVRAILSGQKTCTRRVVKSGSYTPICESCATEIYRGIDICPKCVKLVKTKSTFHWRDHK